ncbi:DUF2087 domain-containing protein [Paenibacillus sp. KN14-4R]|uniref:DUF2087 domain-containing protein n=1 Tax=Paenibacillus sp. KN14-4R TaxID=3445773 RepID=UPI003F9EEC18
MENTNDRFWTASLSEIKQGYVFDEIAEEFICLVCGKTFEDGVIYPAGEQFYSAHKSIRKHIETQHISMGHYLLSLDKKLTGLTDLQKKLIQSFQQGLTDKEIVQQLGGGSASTIRNHRFTLREKAKQAKLFLAIMESLEDQTVPSQRLIDIHRTATMIDERYAITEQENEEILRSYFPDGLEGQLREFPKKEKRKVSILKHIHTFFEPNHNYTEIEVNAILKKIHPTEYVTLRRYLIEYGFMDRLEDCSAYWVKQ